MIFNREDESPRDDDRPTPLDSPPANWLLLRLVVGVGSVVAIPFMTWELVEVASLLASLGPISTISMWQLFISACAPVGFAMLALLCFRWKITDDFDSSGYRLAIVATVAIPGWLAAREPMSLGLWDLGIWSLSGVGLGWLVGKVIRTRRRMNAE